MNWKKNIFVEKTFAHCLLVAPKMPHPQILQRKLLQIATKSQNLLVFFLTSFPLNSIVLLSKHYPIEFLVDIHAATHRTCISR